MSLLNKIREVFGCKPKLRNKAGGMAWINSGVDQGCGEGALIGRIVKTVSVRRGDAWIIEPPQFYIVTHPCTFVANGHKAEAGDKGLAIAITDACLTPIQGDISDEEVRDLYAPKLPEVA